MLPFTIPIHNTNTPSSSPANHQISLTHFLQTPFQSPLQSPFNQYARLPSLISNIFLWLVFFFAIGVLHIGRAELSMTTRIIYGLMMLFIITVCYLFTLFESKGCTEQILLKKRLQLDLIKRELGLLQRNTKLTNFLSVKATNHYNSLRGKYVDYQIYDQSPCERLQSVFYRNIRVIDTPMTVRQHHIHIPDFSIEKNRLCQIFFKFNVSIVGRDADIVRDDIEREFQRIENKLFRSTDEPKMDFNAINHLARIQRSIYVQFQDSKQQDMLLGQRRTCLVYENRMKISCQWFLTENVFWIMTCFGLSWAFRAVFAFLIPKMIVPVYIELEGAMPLPSNLIKEESSSIEGKLPH